MPPLPPRYLSLLGTSYSNPRQLGQLAGQTAAAQASVRGQLLAQLLKQKKLKQQDLSPQDLALAAPKLGQVNTGGGSSLLGKIGGFFGNLGTDVYEAAKGMPGGVWQFIKASAEDVKAAPNPVPIISSIMRGKDSALRREVLEPTLQSYAYTYGGKGAPEGSSLLGRIYQHPLNPILDVATVLSLGAGSAARGAAAASRAGMITRESLPYRALVSTERAPLSPARLPESHIAKGETVPTIPREYSTRPLRRLLQYGTDKAADLPRIGRPVESLQTRIAQTQRQRADFSIKELQGNVAASREAVEPLVPLLSKLSPDEVAAIPLIGMRLNSPRLLELYQQAVREGIAGEAPEGQNAPSAVIPELPESRANLSERTKELAIDPTKSPALTEFLNTYTERLSTRMYPDLGEDKVQEYINMPREKLLERMGETEQSVTPVETGVPRRELMEDIQTSPDEVTLPRSLEGEQPQPNNATNPFAEGFLVPTQVSSDVRYSEPGFIRRMFSKEPGFELGRRRTFNAQNVGYQDLFRTPYMGMRPDVDAVLSGAVRPDPRQFVDFLTKHERDKIESAFNEDLVYSNAVKDEEGNPVKVPGNWGVDKVQQEFGPDFVPVNPDVPWHFYNKEFTVGQAVSKMEAAGLDVSEIMARVGQEAEDMGIDLTLAAQRTPNVVVPKDFANYQLRLATAHRPYENATARTLARIMNTWRTHTLTYMPRWALNTAVGSFALATVKGISPRQYYIAQRLRALKDVSPTVDLADIRYHVTTPEAAGKIERQGLIPQVGEVSALYGQEPGVFTWQDLNFNAADRAAMDEQMPGRTEAFAVNTRGLEGKVDPEGFDETDSIYYQQPIGPERVRRLGNIWNQENWPDPTSLFGSTRSSIRLKPGEKGFFDKQEMAGVNLASIASWDMLEMGAMGHADALNLKTGFISRQVMRRVQQIEDHFRRASFVQSLDKRIQQSINEQGAIISNVERSRGPRTTEEYADYVLQNPDMVRAAIDDLNKFSYNFATLGPVERRYVRQAIPFWGWYKFISSLAYRLPVDFPGRTNVMAQLGMLGANAQDEQYGMVPSWLKGALGLSEGPKGFKYLSTLGLNPFSQIFNPVGPEGIVGGSLQLSQGSPLIQSLLTAYGVDPMRGGETPISPETLAQAGVGRDFFGVLSGTGEGRFGKGQDVDPWQVAGGRRLLASIIRSFPYARIMERQQAGGRSSFPESLPWSPRPMATKPESRFGGAGAEVLEQLIGVAPRPYDLRGWQQLAPKRGDYARTRNRTDLRKLRKNLRKP